MTVDTCVLTDVDLLPYVCLASVLAFLCAVGIGANDLAANFAMVVGSGSMSLSSAVKYCAFFEMLGAALMGGKVTSTITGGIIDESLIWRHAATTVAGMVAASTAATAWLFLSSYYGLPVSITHTVVGSMLGFALFAGSGFRFVQTATIFKIVASWVIAPVGAAIATMILTTLLRRVMLTRGEFLTALRARDAKERAAAGEGRYLPIPSRTPRNATEARVVKEKQRQRSFGGAAVIHLYRYLPLLIAATLGINACFVLLEQPPPIRVVQPFEAQVAVVGGLVAITTYIIYAYWLPTVKQEAEDHRGPFPWQFSMLKIAKQRRSHIEVPRGRSSRRSTTNSVQRSDTGSPEAVPHHQLRRVSQRTINAGGNDPPLLSSSAAHDEPATLGSSLPPHLAISESFVEPPYLEGEGDSVAPTPAHGASVSHVHYRDSFPRRGSDAGHASSSDSTSSSEHEPSALVGSVSFTLGHRGGGMRVRRRIQNAEEIGGTGVTSEGDESTSEEAAQAAHTHSHHHALDDSRGAGWRSVAASNKGTALVPVRAAVPTHPGGKHSSIASPLSSSLVHGSGSAADTSLRAEYLFTALQLIAGAMSSFVHGAVAGANATGPFIVLYTVFMRRMTDGGTDMAVATKQPAGTPEDYSTAFASVIAMAGIAVGMSVLGARLVATVGSKLVVVTPVKGYAMQVGGTFVTMLCTAVGVPVSLSQCQVGAAVGSGLIEAHHAKAQRAKNGDAADAASGGAAPVNWGLVAKLIAGWGLTLVVSAATCGLVLHLMLHLMCGGHLRIR